jgi:hypothetical protein
MIYITREHFYVLVGNDIALLHVGASAQCPVLEDLTPNVQGIDCGGEGVFLASQ